MSARTLGGARHKRHGREEGKDGEEQIVLERGCVRVRHRQHRKDGEHQEECKAKAIVGPPQHSAKRRALVRPSGAVRFPPNHTHVLVARDADKEATESVVVRLTIPTHPTSGESPHVLAPFVRLSPCVHSCWRQPQRLRRYAGHWAPRSPHRPPVAGARSAPGPDATLAERKRTGAPGQLLIPTRATG